MLMHTNMASHVGYVGLAFTRLPTKHYPLLPLAREGLQGDVESDRPRGGWGGAASLLTERPLRSLSGVPRRGCRHCGLGLTLPW